MKTRIMLAAAALLCSTSAMDSRPAEAAVAAHHEQAGYSPSIGPYISAALVVQLCADRNIENDVICKTAIALESRHSHPPCWETNKC